LDNEIWNIIISYFIKTYYKKYPEIPQIVKKFLSIGESFA